MTLLNVCVARNVVQCRHYRCLSYTPSGIILDIETVLNTHLIAQRKQKRWNAYSLDECWFLVVIKTKRATQCDTTETIVRDHIQHRRINRHAARLIINYLVALGHQAFATLHSDISIPFSLASRRWAANFFFLPLLSFSTRRWHFDLLCSPSAAGGRCKIRMCFAKRSLNAFWMVQHSTFIEIY